MPDPTPASPNSVRKIAIIGFVLGLLTIVAYFLIHRG